MIYTERWNLYRITAWNARRLTRQVAEGWQSTIPVTSSMDLSPNWKVSISSAAPEIKSVLHNKDVHYCLHISPLLVLIQSQINPVQVVTFYFWKVGLNIIFPSMPNSSNFSLSFKYTYKIPVISPLPHTCQMSHPSHSPYFDHMICGEEKKHHKTLHYIIFPRSLLLPFRPKYISQKPILEQFQSLFFM